MLLFRQRRASRRRGCRQGQGRCVWPLRGRCVFYCGEGGIKEVLWVAELLSEDLGEFFDDRFLLKGFAPVVVDFIGFILGGR